MDSSALASAESWVYWIGIAKLVATFLVLAGVVIQLGGDWIVRPYEKVINDARNLQIAQLRSDAEKAGAAIADANARAQEAQARALQAQVELEKYKTPRSFKLGELSAIAAAAANFPGVTLHIFIASGTADAVSRPH